MPFSSSSSSSSNVRSLVNKYICHEQMCPEDKVIILLLLRRRRRFVLFICHKDVKWKLENNFKIIISARFFLIASHSQFSEMENSLPPPPSKQ